MDDSDGKPRKEENANTLAADPVQKTLPEVAHPGKHGLHAMASSLLKWIASDELAGRQSRGAFIAILRHSSASWPPASRARRCGRSRRSWGGWRRGPRRRRGK